MNALRAAAALVCLAAVAVAQDAAKNAAKRALPRILLLGDASCNNHFQNAQKALKGRADVVRSPLGNLATGAALARIEDVLQQQRWDVICCNYGLSDLMHRDPASKRVRAMSRKAGGVPVTGPAEYRENLRKLAGVFRKSSARVVWLTTMPLHPRQRSGALVASDIERYNAVATPLWRELGVEVVDLHAQITQLLAKAKNPRARERQHNQLFKSDLSAPLVEGLGFSREQAPQKPTKQKSAKQKPTQQKPVKATKPKR